MSDVTQLLEAVDRGDAHAAEELLPLVYGELRKLAAVKMAQERAGQTLQPTALVHEAWLRIAGEEHGWANRRHFFAAAAQAMQRILVERARRRSRKKHGGELQRIDLDQVDVAATADDDTVLRVHESLGRLEAKDAVAAQLIRLRFFVGLSNVEAAKVLDLSERTAKRVWAYSRAWLYEDMRREG
jgi:RNA polymerase sigma factor (TIGR02999 family)